MTAALARHRPARRPLIRLVETLRTPEGWTLIANDDWTPQPDYLGRFTDRDLRRSKARIEREQHVAKVAEMEDDAEFGRSR